MNVYKNSSKIFKHKVILKKSDKKLVAYNFVHNFAQRSLKIFLSRKTEGIDPMMSWQPLELGRCQIQLRIIGER